MGIVDMIWAAGILIVAGWILCKALRCNNGVCAGCSGCAGGSCAKTDERRKEGMIRLS